ncbi:MAG: ABC transporter ATP-binding protein, partial [Pseudomonadota bacterium]
MTASLLSVHDLSIALKTGSSMKTIVSGLNFEVSEGRVLSIVGESGSGKSMTGKSLMGLLPKGAQTTGKALFKGRDLLDGKEARAKRGVGIGMIFQEPMSALNPVLSIGEQLTEAIVSHGLADPADATDQAIDMLGQVEIPEPAATIQQFPHELSGGMRQRVLIAMTMLLKPELVVADEPTTALDVTVQAQILDLLRSIVEQTKIGLILITHDMGVVAETANDVLVMKEGRSVEAASVKSLFAAPNQPYTQALLAAVPRLDKPGNRPRTEGQKPKSLLIAQGLSKQFYTRSGLFSKTAGAKALDDVSLEIAAGETLALVGESGSGKSTLGRAIARLTDLDDGSITIDGTDMLSLRGRALRSARGKVQMIFQDPYSSMDPRFSVGRTIAEPVRIHNPGPHAGTQAVVTDLLSRVGLSADMASRYPHEFSGGQRQRIAIARALAANPKLLVADEPTSALDVSIQAQVLDLIDELKKQSGLTLLFISHDLAVVKKIADRVAVMRTGRILEIGPTEAVLSNPRHPYTKALIASAPIPDPTRVRGVRPRIAASYRKAPL